MPKTPLLLFRIEVLEDGDEEPYVYEYESWAETAARISQFDGMAVSYTITHYYPWAKKKE